MCSLADSKCPLDDGYLEDILPSSVPVLCEIAVNEDLPKEVRTRAFAAIGRYASEEDRPFNLPTLLAEKAYKGLDRLDQLRADKAYKDRFPK